MPESVSHSEETITSQTEIKDFDKGWKEAEDQAKKMFPSHDGKFR